MVKEELKEYPFVGNYDVDLQMCGIGTVCINEIMLDFGEKLVYLDQRRRKRGVEIVSDILMHSLARDIVVAGYKVEPEGLFRFLKSSKIRVVPEDERAGIETKVLEVLKDGEYIERVVFWD